MITWNRNQLGQVKKSVVSELSTIEKISIVGIGVSVISLLWNMHVFSCKKASKK